MRFVKCMRTACGLAAILAFGLAAAEEPTTATPLFDGKSFEGWQGDTETTWRIEDGMILGGSLTKSVPRNEFLCTKRSYENFELRVKYKLVGTQGFVNGGVQFRTRRIPGSHEVEGYQADLGMGYDGALYDESRRNRVLARPSREVLAKALKKDDWNEYRIRAEGARIQLWLNGVPTVDYTETDDKIPRAGIIALQIHGGCKAVAHYKDIVIEELPATPGARP
jgi:hypothetical protein